MKITHKTTAELVPGDVIVVETMPGRYLEQTVQSVSDEHGDVRVVTDKHSFREYRFRVFTVKA